MRHVPRNKGRGAPIPGAWSPRRPKFRMVAPRVIAYLLECLSLPKTMAPSRKRHLSVRFTGRCRIVGPQYHSCYMSPFWRPEFGGDAKIFGKSVDTCIKADVLIGRKRKHSSGTWLRTWPSGPKTNFTFRYDTLLRMTRPLRLLQRLKADEVEDGNSGNKLCFCYERLCHTDTVSLV
jgi:hypothetical protein